MTGYFTARTRVRSLMLCVSLACAGNAGAAPVSSNTPLAEAAMLAEAPATPFGLSLISLPEGSLTHKWHRVEQAINDDLKVIAACRDDRSSCASPAAIRFLDIIEKARGREGLARIGDINRAINLAIRPVSDLVQYGIDDLWTSPLATFNAGAGDCEDYAIAKFVALREAGVAPSDVKLVILRDIITQEDHAIVTARSDGRWRLLDNRYLAMLDDSEAGHYRPIFAIDEDGAKRFEPPVVFATLVPPGVTEVARSVAVATTADAYDALRTTATADLSAEPSSFKWEDAPR